MQANFDYLWRREDLSDLKLLITWTDSAKPSTLNLHSQVLIHYSIYFRSALTSEVGCSRRKKRRPTDEFRYSVSEDFQSSEEPAVLETLEFMYTQQFSKPGSAMSDIVLANIMKVSDRWEAEAPLQAASNILCTHSTTSMCNAVFSLPPGLNGNPAFSAVIAAAQAQLLVSYGNAHTTIVNPSLLQQFNTLSIGGVETLLSSPSFVTDTEESVFHLVCSWCESHGATHNTMVRMRTYIRYSRISAPYAMNLCSRIIPPLTLRQMAQLFELRDLPEAAHLPDLEPGSSPQWYLPTRTLPTQYDGVPLTLSVSRGELKRLLACVSAGTSSKVTSDVVYGEGFLWSIVLSVSAGELWCVVSARGVISVNDLSSSAELQHGVFAYISMKVEGIWPLIIISDEAPQLVTAEGVGMKCESASGLDWWNQYIRHGVIKISARLTRAAR